VRARYLQIKKHPQTDTKIPSISFLSAFSAPGVAILRRVLIFVGWVEQSETQPTQQNVGFRSSTQPTHFLFFCQNLRSIAWSGSLRQAALRLRLFG
jgi:hypothetical protein